MAFTTFIDDLALVEVLLLLIAAVLAYAGVRVFWAIRQDRPDDVRRILQGSAVPVAGLGLTTLLLALWGEMTWPFLASDGLAGYNIYFFDPMVLLGVVLVGFGVAAARSLPLQYLGVAALIAGGVAAFYGWTGYTASPAFTKEPFDAFLLYGAFGLSGLLALPTSVLVDHYLAATARGDAPWVIGLRGVGHGTVRRLDQRAAQAMTSPPVEPVVTRRAPAWVQIALLAFPVAMTLAAIAALWFFGTTLPGHLGAGPSAAP